MASTWNKEEKIVLSGKTKFFKANQLNKFGKWSHDLYLDEKSLEEFKRIKNREGGIKNNLKKDDDGYYITLSRDPRKTYKNRTVLFEPPKVTNSAGEDIFNQNVGHGSDIISTLQLFWFKTPSGAQGSAVRWLSTEVTNLIPYHPKEETEDQGIKEDW